MLPNFPENLWLNRRKINFTILGNKQSFKIIWKCTIPPAVVRGERKSKQMKGKTINHASSKSMDEEKATPWMKENRRENDGWWPRTFLWWICFVRNWIDLVAEHVGLVLAPFLPAEDCTLQSGMCNPRKSSMAPRRPALTMTNRRESSFRWNEIRKRRTCPGGRIFGGVKKETRWMADRAALIEFFRHCFAPAFDWNVHRTSG